MRLFVLAAAAATLAACQPAEAPEAAKTETPAAANSADALPTSDDGPEAFVRNVFTSLANDGPAPLGEEGLWSAATWRAMKAYEAAAPEGYNSDPLCNCQDPMGLAIRDLAVTSTGAASADAAVTITQGEAQTSMVLNLVREGESWRIDNITREGDPDFKSELAMWTAEAEGQG